MKLIRITSIYGETFIRKEIKRNKIGVFTDKGFVPFEDIESIEIMGEILGVDIKDENKYKTFEELKEELGDKFEEYMYKSNIELLTRIDKAREYLKEREEDNMCCSVCSVMSDKLLKILGDDEK